MATSEKEIMETGYPITVRYPSRDGGSFSFHTTDRILYPMAMRLRYVVANRERITEESRGGLEQMIESEILQMLEGQLNEAELDGHLRGIGRARAAEVQIPFVGEHLGWAARMFPWENALGLMTKRYRADEPLLVVRYLMRSQPPKPPAEKVDARGKAGHSLMVVRSSPGQLNGRYQLQEECEQVRDGYYDISDEGCGRHTLLVDPTLSDFEAELKAKNPAVIHLAGVDSSILDDAEIIKQRMDGKVRDGFVMSCPTLSSEGENSRRHQEASDVIVGDMYHLVPAATLASAMKSGRAKNQPRTMVTMSSYFSAPRVAALTVAFGASQHAIGLQDTLTDEQCGLFFGTFYSMWEGREEDILSCFFKARRHLVRNYNYAVSAGVVLWSARSWFERGLLEKAVSDVAPTSAAAKKPLGNPPSAISIWMKPVTSLNYSLLHNDQPIFEQFTMMKLQHGVLEALTVEVSLDTGGAQGSCSCRVTLPSSTGKLPYRLASMIKLPLVAELMRSCSESVRTNLHVKVSCGKEVLLEQNHAVRVLPADEWRDDGRDHCWLPSFIMPRDPAVLKIRTSAQRYLRALADDCKAAFDGYQSVGLDPQNPWNVVDLQVQAIWAAIQHDLELDYINPPPTYGNNSQRLRTPSQILEGGAATCIDLALLFASCLEYVGIYPVIFLIEGHAFPGYWRSDAEWWEMVGFENTMRLFDDGYMKEDSLTRGSPKGWMLQGDLAFSEVTSYLQEGLLVPLESTFVTKGKGESFRSACIEGRGNLQPQSFDCMVDVWFARLRRVTPLPLTRLSP